eukprot:COSAG06_NODE_73176_length_161_cov_114.725806_1_plen_26_part_01
MLAVLFVSLCVCASVPVCVFDTPCCC